jgi:hypothetical protein
MNLRQLAYGILSFLPGLSDAFSKGTGGTGSARYCYCIWMRHLRLASAHGLPTAPAVVGELGPGDSIGVGLAALISGSERYVALDALAHADAAQNLRIFDELVALFRARAPIPPPSEFPEITLHLPDYAFPSDLLEDARLTAALAPERIARLRETVANPSAGERAIVYRAPWDKLQPDEFGSIDFLLSNAVMEHVVDLLDAYRAVVAWLRPGGFASHQIDFRSHGLFAAWDGHWACPDWLWTLFRGRRPYLLNREPFATHRRIGLEAGLVECAALRVPCAAASHRLSSRFSEMSDEDRNTCGGYLLQRRG